MIFASEWPSACISSFSSPFQAHALLTTALDSGATSVQTAYEFVTSTYIGGSGTTAYKASTIANIVTVSQGLAVADPVVVAWQTKDFQSFPTAYATSLAQKIGIKLNDTSPTLNDTSPISAGKGLSTGAKAGIGVGVVFGAAIFGIPFVLWYLRRHRKKTQTVDGTDNVAEMEDQDGTLAGRKWFLGGKWRSEASAIQRQQELDSKTVRVVPGPPVELDGTERQPGSEIRHEGEQRRETG